MKTTSAFFALLIIAPTFILENATAAVRYVNVSSTNSAPPYLTWATAATTIQEAVDAAEPGDEVLVANGVYETGGSVVPGSLHTNRVAVTKPVAVRSVNGQAFTIIRGEQIPGVLFPVAGIRCVYLGAGASLTGFTLTNGAAVAWGTNASAPASRTGGGIRGETTTAVVSNCVIVGNAAMDAGGGVSGGTLFQCTLTGNDGSDAGGGAYNSILFNCTLVGNYAFGGGGAVGSSLVNCTVVSNMSASISGSRLPTGGGVSDCTITNSIVYYNSGSTHLDNHVRSALSYSCTTPLPTNGWGNITSAPLFVNLAGGDFRLEPDSPCIDAGMDLSAIVANDFFGFRRPLDGNRDGVAGFDMGANEFNPLFQTSISKIGTNVRVCWFDNVPGMKLQTAPSIDGIWSDVAVPPDTTCIELPVTSSNVFFRRSLPQSR